MPVLILEKKAAAVKEPWFQPFANFVATRVKLPAWTLFVLVVLAIGAGFSAGRRHPARHYVPYFGYPMVMDTTTGKACYAIAPRPTGAVHDTAYAIDGTVNALDKQADSGPAIPLCGQE